MRITVIGTGHVGLITCATLAELGHTVIGHDADEEKLQLLGNGVAPFHEPGLEELLRRGMAERRLSFVTDIDLALDSAEVVFICVGTPPRASGEADLLAVELVARQVARHAPQNVVVVEKSTVPAGTARRVLRTLRLEGAGPGRRTAVVSNPEFLREGQAIRDSLAPDRILIGADNAEAFRTMREVYGPLLTRGHLLIETDIETAELAKHACNAFLALKISYANALARICERLDADVVSIARVMGTDPRIGEAFLDAGLGYGGYCFPKDLVAFEKLAASAGHPFPLLKEVARINAGAIDAIFQKVRDALWNLRGKRIGLLGLSFKPGTDDVRFSPALALGSKLLREGAEVVGYDPQAAAAAKAELPGLELAPDPYAVAEHAHCVVVCTAWREIVELDPQLLRSVMTYPILVDGRNVFEPDVMRAAGLAYFPTGRPPVLEPEDAT